MAVLGADVLGLLQDSLRRLLKERSDEAAVRKTMETQSGYDVSLWKQLAELGIAGLAIDERHGGAGASLVEVEAVMEDMGAALLCSPFLSTSVMAPALLNAAGDPDAAARWLPAIARGDCIAALALTNDRGRWTAADIGVSGGLQDESWSLRGHASYVVHGQNANVLLVLANTVNGTAIFEVDPKASGVALKPLPAFDHTLRLARIEFAAAPAKLIGKTGGGWHAAEVAMKHGLVALAGEQAGGAKKVLDITVEYAKTRIQFGRAIGSFQAIKHMAADLLLETESAISAARHAASAVANETKEAESAVSLAAFACADAFSTVTATSVQMHGGIAFTWEYPAHLYLRRARADAQLFGTPTYHRERYVQQLGG